mgnify:CR=1
MDAVFVRIGERICHNSGVLRYRRGSHDAAHVHAECDLEVGKLTRD